MIKKLLLFSTIIVLSLNTFAQVGQGALKGKIIDKANREPIPFANIILERNGSLVAGGTSDFDGKYDIKPIPPGKYDIKIKYVGYQDKIVNGVQINADQITSLNFEMSQGIDLTAVEIVDYEVPLISKDQTTTGGTIAREQIAKMPGRSAESIAITVGGIYSADGERGSVRGSREGATDTYIDGIKVRGSTSVPNQAIEQVSVFLGGLPAQYGDATGGVISITTRGPSSKYFGGFEFVSSKFLDAYNYNLLAASVSGPLLMRKDPNDPTKKSPLLGFFLSTELRYEQDPRPSAVGSWRVKKEVSDELQRNPLRPTGTGFGAFPNTQFIRLNDVDFFKTRADVASRGLLLQGKIDLVTSTTTQFTVGGTLDLSRSRISGVANGFSNQVYNNTLFNSGNNPDINSNTWRVYTRFTQRFGNSQEQSNSLIKNAFYTIQVDYSKVTEKVQDINHRENFFNYGYVGRFNSTFIRTYQAGFNEPYITPSGDTAFATGSFMNGFRRTRYDYSPGTANPFLAGYTSQYYTLYDQIQGNYETPEQIQSGRGLLNGDVPGSVYGLWTSPGVPNNRFSTVDNSMFRVVATGSANIKDHQILLGFEFEQRNDRLFLLAPRGLWTRARQLTNAHILEIDRWAVPEIDNSSGTYPIFTFPRLNPSKGEYSGQINEDRQSFFDYNIRKAAGLNPDGTDFVDIDSFDPNTLKLEYFNADELLNNGNGVVSYFGFDHTGKKIRGRPSFDDFFTATDEFGNYKRLIPSYQPIYMAGFIQDKFSFDDLVFNIGLRVDRFDANQPVLIDNYSLFPTVRAGESITRPDAGHPSNIGEDFVVYVSDVNNPNSNNIVGYRDGDRWFNSRGQELADPTSLFTAQGIAPWLQDVSRQNSRDIQSNAFQDYKPQINVMPRIAFSFPISDEALFFAHYDILTRRPFTGVRLDPTDYMFLQSVTGATINNPSLRPERTIEYELGFQQKLNNTSSLKIATYYRELRDMIQLRYYQGAFPRDYVSYSNQDFGTIKGITFSYDLRRTKNFEMRAAYTLQFADATGSAANTGVNLIQSGAQNLRTIFPLDYDQRHQITTAFDYRFTGGRDYNGPILFDKQILADAGLNVTFQGGSGVPYTRNQFVVQAADDVGDRSVVKGQVNGSRLPWQFRMDVRLDKDFKVNLGSGENKKPTTFNVYVLLLNALNAKNILNVYRSTGNPTDDGYLAAAEFQDNINTQNDPTSFRELYALKLNSPFNFSLPRRIRFGLIYNF